MLKYLVVAFQNASPQHQTLKPTHTDVELAKLVWDAFIPFFFFFFWCYGSPSVDQLSRAAETGSAGHSNELTKSEVVLNVIKRLDEHSYGSC